MANLSAVTSIILSAYSDMEKMKATYFCIFFFLYITIIAENVLLITVICGERSLHEPMYFLVCNLAANGIYGGTGLLPAIMKNILSHSYEISLPCCQAQIYVVHTYVIIEFTIIAAMSYDRYVAICHPLQYHAILSLTKVYKLIAFTWLYPLVTFVIYNASSLHLQFCEKTIAKLYCVNYSLVKLSCTDTFVLNILGLLTVFVYVFPQLIMIVYSYVHILRICIMSSKDSKLKALRTCTPHLFAVLNYSVGSLFELIQSRYDMSYLSYQIQIFMSLYFLIIPPLLNPAIYGLSIQSIRKPLFRMFQGKKSRLRPI